MAIKSFDSFLPLSVNKTIDEKESTSWSGTLSKICHLAIEAIKKFVASVCDFFSRPLKKPVVEELKVKDAIPLIEATPIKSPPPSSERPISCEPISTEAPKSLVGPAEPAVEPMPFSEEETRQHLMDLNRQLKEEGAETYRGYKEFFAKSPLLTAVYKEAIKDCPEPLPILKELLESVEDERQRQQNSQLVELNQRLREDSELYNRYKQVLEKEPSQAAVLKANIKNCPEPLPTLKGLLEPFCEQKDVILAGLNVLSSLLGGVCNWFGVAHPWLSLTTVAKFPFQLTRYLAEGGRHGIIQQMQPQLLSKMLHAPLYENPFPKQGDANLTDLSLNLLRSLIPTTPQGFLMLSAWMLQGGAYSNYVMMSLSAVKSLYVAKHCFSKFWNYFKNHDGKWRQEDLAGAAVHLFNLGVEAFSLKNIHSALTFESVEKARKAQELSESVKKAADTVKVEIDEVCETAVEEGKSFTEACKATCSAIEKQYRQEARIVHPDKSKEPPAAFIALQEARDLLKKRYCGVDEIAVARAKNVAEFVKTQTLQVKIDPACAEAIQKPMGFGAVCKQTCDHIEAQYAQLSKTADEDLAAQMGVAREFLVEKYCQPDRAEIDQALQVKLSSLHPEHKALKEKRTDLKKRIVALKVGDLQRVALEEQYMDLEKMIDEKKKEIDEISSQREKLAQPVRFPAQQSQAI